jgi:hypothetical protein
MIEEFKSRISIPNILYWSLPALIFAVEMILISLEAHQVRYEELAESIRNPYWFSQRMLYDGVSSNIGWYGLLHYTYSIVGFSLLSGRTVKAVLFLASLIALARLALGSLDRRTAALVVVSVGLSPIYLYFSRMMTSYGTDIIYALLWLWTLSFLTWRGGTRDYAITTAAWLLAFLGCSSFPALIFYMPSMGLYFAWGLWRNRDRLSRREMAAYILATSGAFLLPLLAAVLYIETPLLFDARTNSGIFRGSGQLEFDPAGMLAALKILLSDAFVIGSSYYVEIERPDFSSVLSWIALATSFVTVIHCVLHRPEARVHIGLAGLIFVLALLGPCLSPNHPGIRRGTGFVFAIYLGYAIALWHLSTSNSIVPWLRRTGYLCLVLLPISHLLALPSAYASVQTDSRYRYALWFGRRDTPERAFEYWLDFTARHGTLPCHPKPGTPIRWCRYSEIFGALEGHRLWNDEPAVPIRINHPRTGVELKLSPHVWEAYILWH